MSDPYIGQIQENILRTILAIAAQQEGAREREALAPSRDATAELLKAQAQAYTEQVLERQRQSAAIDDILSSLRRPAGAGSPTGLPEVGLPPLPPGGGVLRDTSRAGVDPEKIMAALASGAIPETNLLTLSALMKGELPPIPAGAGIKLGTSLSAAETGQLGLGLRAQNIQQDAERSRFYLGMAEALGVTPTMPTPAEIERAGGNDMLATLNKFAGTSTLAARALPVQQLALVTNAYANLIQAEAQKSIAAAQSLRVQGGLDDNRLEQLVRVLTTLSTSAGVFGARANTALIDGDKVTAKMMTDAMQSQAAATAFLLEQIGIPSGNLSQLSTPEVKTGFFDRVFGGFGRFLGGQPAGGLDQLTPEQISRIAAGEDVELPGTAAPGAAAPSFDPTRFNQIFGLGSTAGPTGLPLSGAPETITEEEPEPEENVVVEPAPENKKALRESALKDFIDSAPTESSTTSEVDRWLTEFGPDTLDRTKLTRRQKLDIVQRLISESIRAMKSAE